MTRDDRRSTSVRRAATLALLVLGAGFAVHAAGWDDLQSLRSRASGTGAAGALLYAVAYAALTLTPLPKNAMSATAGLAFGFGTGLVVVWLGAVAGAMVAFTLARRLGRGRERVTGVQVGRLDALLEGRGLAGAVLVRLVPVLPFTAVNYGSGFTALRVRHYVIGTAVGILPGSVVFVAAGAGLIRLPGA